MIEAVLFDLDGTLADTAIDLGSALNQLRLEEGLLPLSLDEIRPVASHGAKGLLKLGLDIEEGHPQYTQWRKRYLDGYEMCFREGTILFLGINELIMRLHQQGLKWGIITNKPKQFTDRLIPVLKFIIEPQVIVSGDTTSEAKPSVKPMFFACEILNIKPENCLYVGDAERDMQAGRNAGMKTVLAEWGYIGVEDNISEWPVDFYIQKPAHILDII